MLFCWLIEWSLEKYKDENFELHNGSLNFLKEIIPYEFEKAFKVESCDIYMQRKKMDFIANINNLIIIHFEDKIKSDTTNNQLSNYKERLKKDFPNHRIYHIYLKTDLVWRYEKNIVKENKYVLIDLLKIGKILKNISSSDIYNDFYLKINQKINDFFLYKSINPKNWNYTQWIGFVYDLSSEIDDYYIFGKHFVGEDFWFVFSRFKINNFEDSYVSFELYNKKCAIKAHVYDTSTNKTDFSNYIKEQINNYFKDFKIKSYNRTAKNMLLIEFFDFIVIENDIIEFQKTKQNLLKIRKIFEQTISNVGKKVLHHAG